MMWKLWRIAALGVAVLGLGLSVGDVFSPAATQGFHATLAAHGDVGRFKVVSVAPERDVHPDVRVGDVLRLHEPTAAERLRYARQRVGDAFVFDREGAGPVTVHLIPAPERPVAYVYLAIALAFLGVGALLAIRRPQLRDVRALASMLVLFGLALTASPQTWMPVWVVGAMVLVANVAQFTALGFAVHLATVFPDPAAGGVLARIRQLNVAVVAALVVVGLWISVSVTSRGACRPARS
jgi:hypothetical protein